MRTVRLVAARLSMDDDDDVEHLRCAVDEGSAAVVCGAVAIISASPGASGAAVVASTRRRL